MKVQPIATHPKDEPERIAPIPFPTWRPDVLARHAVVMTVWNQPAVVRDVLRALHARTAPSVPFVIVDDASGPHTHALLLDACVAMRRDGRDARLLTNERNARYTRSINRGFDEAFAIPNVEWAIAFNSDVWVPDGWLERLAIVTQHDDPTIGIVCPYMSAGGLITLDQPAGSNYRDADARLWATAPRRAVPCVTPVGALMAVRKSLWEELGPFDVGKSPEGYGEEGDLWGRALDPKGAEARGFTWQALLVPWLLVYHQHHASFGPEARERERAGTEMFLSLHGKIFQDEIERLAPLDPKPALTRRLARVRIEPERPRFAFYTRGIVLCGGVLACINVCNQLVEHGIDATIVYEYDEVRDLARMPMRFQPIRVQETHGAEPWTRVGGFARGILLATSWGTSGFVRAVARRHPGVQPGCFIQDREDLFRQPNGQPWYQDAHEIESYLTLVPAWSVVNSNWVAASMEAELNARPQRYIPIGVDVDLFHPEERTTDRPIRILAFSRPSTPRRGYGLLRSVYRKLRAFYGNAVELLTYDQQPLGDVPCRHLGKLRQADLADVMRSADILIEPSWSQGWGMPAQEMMATGGAVVSTDNGGIHNYGRHDENCLIVPTDAQALFDATCRLVDDRPLRDRLGARARLDMQRFSWERVGRAWADAILEWSERVGT